MHDRFLFRLFWLTLAAAFLILLWQDAPSLIARYGPRETAQPRVVAARGDLAADEQATIALFEHARDSVVYISTRAEVMDVWTRNVFSVPQGTGSGFIWDDAGHVVTNYHVIAKASEATVKLADGRSFRAALVGASQAHDIAVLKIGVAFKRPPPVALGSSHDLRVGQKVFAIGNPFGLDWTLTSGIVSALDRSMAEESGNNIDHLIQTDAAINPGNSGGPLLDSAGRLIGINTAIYSPSGTSAGIGFAVPVDTVNRVVPELISKGRYVAPALGIRTNDALNPRLTAMQGTPGVMVLGVAADSAAAQAGLQPARQTADGRIIPGDIITMVGGKAVATPSELSARLDDFRIGDEVGITIQRAGQRQEVRATLQAGE